MASASLTFVILTWYLPMASSATCTTPRMADSSSEMIKFSCDIESDIIYNTISDISDSKHIFYAAADILISNEFFDDSHTTYNSSMHFDLSTLQGDSSVSTCGVSANAFVSDLTHSMAVHISSALQRLQTYIYRLRVTVRTIKGWL